MKRNMKGLTIAGLLVLCVILSASLIMLNQSPKGVDVLPDMSSVASANISPGGIDDNPMVTPNPTASAVNPNEITSSAPIVGVQNGNDIQLTVIEDKPEPPELPDTAPRSVEMDGETWDALDPALTNPDVVPDITPAPVEPNKSTDNAPQSGDTNSNGEVYIPGFGWVKDEGGGSQGSQSQLDPNHSDFDKMVGH